MGQDSVRETLHKQHATTLDCEACIVIGQWGPLNKHTFLMENKNYQPIYTYISVCFYTFQQTSLDFTI